MLAGFILTPACQPALPLLEQVKQQGELVVATRTGPTTYYREMDRETGFEFELAQAFANYLGVKMRMVAYDDLGELLTAVRTGKVHLAAAGLSVTPERSHQFRFTSPYEQVTQDVIFRAGTPKPVSIEDLYQRKLVVLAQSSHSEYLQQLQQSHPELRWEEKANATALTLLNMVNESQADVAVVDSAAFQTYRPLFPELQAAFPIKQAEPVSWAFQITADDSLFNMAELFFNQINASGDLEELRERFFGHREFDYVGARTFLTHLDTRLVEYEPDFKAAADEVGMDWRLLAAVGYQESLWNPNAISPTGVRGLMMLTQQTATEMGVTDRRDAEQSIRAGARYLKKLYDKLPQDLQEPHRTWFALAAYNVGYGHLMDARRLARHEGLDPNDWFVVREKL
ncbi:MAG TPA: membrane-bound lytic murein transglycosylase MltF, partial [Candidatus Kapabacteria bacterium]|nr:membrane-bound lytic murein transglycosylase MltF [Candidatus Kapabacteria bacterium]